MLTPYPLDAPDTALPATQPDDPRLGHLVRQGVPHLDDAGLRCGIVGFPSDEGVRRNGGRPGARNGPARLRPWLYRLTPDARNARAFTEICRATVDLGDLRCTGDVEADQEQLGRLVGDLLARGVVPIVVGGGHETSYGHFLGYVRARRPARIVNVDAHPDVRPCLDGKGHSGSPFRQMLEAPGGFATTYTVAGLQPHAVAPAHLDYIARKGGRVLWRDAAPAAALAALYAAEVAGEDAVLASFDLDAVDQAYAPGVSAPNPMGLDRADWLAACEAAGRSPAVTSVDLVEFNPAFDVDHRTARLAALSVWHVLKGLAHRPG